VNGFIDHLYTPLGTTSTYSAIANLHNLQITRALAKPFSSLLCLQQLFSNNGFQQRRFFSFPRSRRYFPANILKPKSLNRPGVLAIQPRGATNRKHRLQHSLYCFYGRLPSDSPDIVSAGTCLPSRCSETAICLFAYCIATTVLVVCFEVFA
jgi:hypothetical protein